MVSCSQTVIIIELTCPAEEGIEAAQTRKKARYEGLLVECRENSWSPSLFTVEVGARGFVCRSLHRCLSSLGVIPKTKKALCKVVSLIVAKCSLAILQSHSSHVWDKNRVRLSADLWQPRPPLHSIRLIPYAPSPDGEKQGVGLADAEEDVKEEGPIINTPESDDEVHGADLADSEDEKEERGY